MLMGCPGWAPWRQALGSVSPRCPAAHGVPRQCPAVDAPGFLAHIGQEHPQNPPSWQGIPTPRVRLGGFISGQQHGRGAHADTASAVPVWGCCGHENSSAPVLRFPTLSTSCCLGRGVNFCSNFIREFVGRSALGSWCAASKYPWRHARKFGGILQHRHLACARCSTAVARAAGGSAASPTNLAAKEGCEGIPCPSPAPSGDTGAEASVEGCPRKQASTLTHTEAFCLFCGFVLISCPCGAGHTQEHLYCTSKGTRLSSAMNSCCRGASGWDITLESSLCAGATLTPAWACVGLISA